MKRLISILLVLSICLSLGSTALAADKTAFTDVKEADWYHDAVQWAAEKGIVSGLSDTEFGAQATVTRAMMVTLIWRMAGSPKPAAVYGFADVPEGSWYSGAVNWAAEQGIANGVSETAFLPNNGLTREQAAAFLYRYEKLRGGGFPGSWNSVLDYSDADQVAQWAVEPMCWMTLQGVLQGYQGNLRPKSLCSRAEAVTMLYRFAEERKGPTTAADAPAYTEKEVPVLRDSLDSDETATLRFYADLPNVPYMEISDYYNTFYLACTDETEGLTEAREGSCFTLTNLGGYTAEADIDADTITAEDATAFFSAAYYLLLEVEEESDENYPFLQEEDMICLPEECAPLTLRLGDYGIDLRGGEDGLYLPLGTLSDLYATTDNRYTVYNGEKLYAEDYMEVFQTGSAIELDEDFGAPFHAPRAADLAEFTYRELCFNIDTFYGRPGQEYLHEALEKASLDEILSKEYPRVKRLLLSADYTDFFAGLSLLLHGCLFDGGHTGMISKLLWEDEDLLTAALEPLFEEECAVPFLAALFGGMGSAPGSEAQEAAYQKDFYLEQGDTAMIRFHAFEVDSDAWKAYYAGTGEMPLEGDTLGTVYAGLRRAASNPAIKNVVFDVSCNDGGNSGAMVAVEWLTTGQGSVRYRNRLTGQTQIGSVRVDANFDGVFDERDRPFTQFRYAVLTSSYSFSCSNAFPFFMREQGAMILGEQSSGGACAIRISAAGGIEFSMSSADSCIVTETGGSVDNGCPVDVELLAEAGDPYAPFYDLAVISEAMNSFFGAAAMEPAA